MNVWKTEWKTGWISVTAWTLVLGGLMGTCILLFPELSKDQEGLNDLFSQMGTFSSAFGLDKLNFGTFGGYFGVECGNVIGLGGALFAGLTGFSLFQKERSVNTMGFWLAHPMSACRFYMEKWCALLSFILVLNLGCFLITALCTLLIREELTRGIFLLILGYTIVQILIGTICFGISAVWKKAGIAVGAGIAAGFWFLDLISKISPDAEWLKTVCIFSIADAPEILETGNLPLAPLMSGSLLAALAFGAGCILFVHNDSI